MKFSSSLAFCALIAVASFIGPVGEVEARQPASTATYYPPAGSWAHKPASDLGMNQELLDAAVAFAQTRESKREMDFSDQERIFGSMLGSVPDIRARTNGIVIYKGYVVAEFGDTSWVDPTYSVAKSMMSTVAAIALRDGKIRSLEEPVGRTIKDGGYDSPHNALVTWKMHLQQESEWQGTMFGKKDDFIGKEAFGQGERQPREIKPPGTYYEYNDVRINRFGLSLLRAFGQSVPSVFRREVMAKNDDRQAHLCDRCSALFMPGTSTWLCPSCGAEVPTTRRTCGKYGSGPSRSWRCPQCNTELPVQAPACPRCGGTP